MSDLRLWTSGTAGDYASTPDSAALDAITQDITIVVQFLTAPDTTNDFGRVIDKSWTSPNRAWAVWLRTSGVVAFRASSDGTTGDNTVDWSYGSNLPAGTWLKIESLWTGSQRETTFSTSPDGVTWTARSTQVYGVAAIATNNERVTIAANEAAASRTAGQYGAIRVYDGDEATGTLVLDFDPARDAALGDTTVTSSTTGEVWTLSGDALLIGAPAAAQAVTDRPLYLDLPGAAADYAWAPTTFAPLAALAQDLTIVAHLRTFTTGRGTTDGIVSRNTSSPNRSWVLWRAPSDVLQLYLSGDGSAWDSATFNATTTYVTDDTWVKVESLVTSGQRDTKWYTSPVGPDHPAFSGWTLRETDSNAPTSTTIFDNSSYLVVGGNGTTGSWPDAIGRVLVYAGDEDTGALIADFAPERDAHLGAGSFTSSNTGEVWTLAGTAELRSAGGRIDWANADDEGLELPSRDVISGLTAPARRHNIATTPQRAGGYLVQSPLPNPRTVTVPVILRPAAPYTRARLDELRQRFAGVLHHPQLGRLIVADQNSDLRELRCFLANGLTGAEAMPAHEFDTLQFVAPDPYFYDLDDDTASIVSGTNTLTVAGDTDTPPIFTITGGASSNITSVTLERVDTGETLALTLTSALTTGVGLVIDHAAGTVLRAGSDIFSDLTSPTFFDLASGASSQVALTLGGTAGSYTGSVTYRPRWLTAYPAAS